MKAGEYASARPIFERLILLDSSDWSLHYMAGQCCRFTGDVESALSHLNSAVALKKDDPHVFLALGIAHQANKSWESAIQALHTAIELDQDYELAYNSLALTQKKMGSLEVALQTYDAGAKALARRIVKAMINDRSSPIYKHEDTQQDIWCEYAVFGATYLACLEDGIRAVAFPSGDMAAREERTKEHRGLYWIDTQSDKGEASRLFLPNYFNTFREALKKDKSYANLIGNRGTVLEMVGQTDMAKKCFEEAEYFAP